MRWSAIRLWLSAAMVAAGALGLGDRLQAEPPGDAATPQYDDGIHTELQTAAWLGDQDRVRTLLESGTEVDAVDSEHGATPLMFAAAGGHIEVMEMLLAFGADPVARSLHGAPPISYAIMYEEHEAVSLLLAAGVDVNASWFNGTTPLLDASYRGDVAMMSLLLDAGADPTVRYHNRVCALSSAAMSGNPAAVRMLLDLGLDIEATNGHGSSPLMFAVINRHPEVVQMLLEAGAQVDAARKDGDTPLLRAAGVGCSECAELLLNAGAAPDVRSRTGANAIMRAAWHGQADVLDALTMGGVSLHDVDNDGRTALAHAAIRGHAAVIAKLLELGAEIDGVNSSGQTALMLAAKWDREQCVVELLGAGADLSIVAGRGDLTAIDMAIANGSDASLRAMIDAGVIAGAPQSRLDELLQYAASRKSSRETILLFLDRGANPNSKGALGLTPLHHAAGSGKPDTVELLLAAGSDVYALDENGFLPLYRTKFGGANDERERTALLLASAGPDFVNRSEEPRLREWLGWAAERMSNEAFAELVSTSDYIDDMDDELLSFYIQSIASAGQIDKLMLVRERVGHERADPWLPLAVIKSADRTSTRGSTVEELMSAFDLTAAEWPEGESPLHDQTLSLQGMTLALSLGADPNAENASGRRPLGIAMNGRASSLEKMRVLLDHGADPNFYWKDRSAVDLAIRTGRVDQLDVLLSAGADVSGQPQDANWILEASNHAGMLELLVEHGMDVTTQSGDRTAMHLLVHRACDAARQMDKGTNPTWKANRRERFESELDRIRRLYAVGVAVDAVDSQGNTPLMQAWHGDVFLFLVELGADLDAVDSVGRGLLEIALQSGRSIDTRVVSLLCERESTWITAAERGFSPLAAAAANADLEVFEQVLAAVPDIDMPGHQGRTALLFTIDRYVQILTHLNSVPVDQLDQTGGAIDQYTNQADHLRGVIDRLIDAGADPLVRTSNGESALHGRVNIDVVRMLLEHGCDVNARDAAMRTPLIAAAMRQDPVSLRALLDFGADPFLVDSGGRMAIEYMREPDPANGMMHSGNHELQLLYQRVYYRLKDASSR